MTKWLAVQFSSLPIELGKPIKPRKFGCDIIYIRIKRNEWGRVCLGSRFGVLLKLKVT